MLSQTEGQLKAIVKASPKEALLSQEKEAIKSNLAHFMKQHPLPATEPAVFTWLNLRQAIYARPALRYVSLVAVTLMIGGGSIAFAAQNAQPGEALYSVKTGLTEKVLAMTLFSNQAKAEYKINLAQLRLQETETAAAQDKLNDQTSAEVRMLFNDHVTDIQNRLAAINAKEDARVSIELNSQLEALLNAHAKIIDNLAGKKEGRRAAAIKNILSDVKVKADEIKKNRQDSESKLSAQVWLSSKINAENKLLQAEAAWREAAAVVAMGGAQISEPSRQRAEADLAGVRRHVVEGKVKLEAQEYGAAFILFQNAVRAAQEIHIYMSIDIDIIKP